MKVSRIYLDRISSSTRNARLTREVTCGDELIVKEGYILAARVLNDKFTYNTVENVSGRMVSLRSGDILAGVLGFRRALKGYAGVVPEELQVGDSINVLNLGGVLGQCTAINPELGPPFEAEVLGAVLSFPTIGDRIGVPANIFRGSIPRSDSLGSIPPIVYVAGTCMNSGKTVAAREIIRFLSKRGIKISACKLTGVSLMRDILSMQDAGAFQIVDFNDAGVVTTWDYNLLPVVRGLLKHLSKGGPDLIVAELGDGILGEYGVAQILSDQDLMNLACCHVVCAPDPVAIYGAHRLYGEKFDLPVHVVTGPVTDNSVGTAYIEKNLNLPAHNARYDIQGLAEIVLQKYEQWKGKSS